MVEFLILIGEWNILLYCCRRAVEEGDGYEESGECEVEGNMEQFQSTSFLGGGGGPANSGEELVLFTGVGGSSI